MKRVLFFYDFVCPYAYLASLQVDALRAESDVELVYVPMLLGGLFRTIGAPDVVPMPPGKARMNALDMERFARRLGVTLRPPEAHPRRTVLALRAAIASADIEKATHALFAAYWRDGLDVSREDVVRDVLAAAGLDGAAAVTAATAEPIKRALVDNTQRAADAGAFGAPTFVVDVDGEREIFFGQDRLDFVRRKLGVTPAPTTRQGTPTRALDFHFDFSSPYAYLASTQVGALAARAATTLTYRPLLLGALFRSIGTPNVPLLAMPAPKQAYNGRELERWSSHHGVPFKFNTHFPVNTVKALRLVLVAPPADHPRLVDALYRATWVDDHDVSRDEVLLEVLRDLDLDGPAMLARTQEQSVKDVLKQATADAEARGIFGVPTFQVGDALFWGQDRMQLVEDALLAR